MVNNTAVPQTSGVHKVERLMAQDGKGVDGLGTVGVEVETPKAEKRQGVATAP